jgi:hypothetical protein
MATVLFTVFALGGTTKLLLDLLDIETGVPPYAEDPSKLLPSWIEERLIDPKALALRRQKQPEHSRAMARATPAKGPADACGVTQQAAAMLLAGVKGAEPFPSHGRGETPALFPIDGRGETQAPPGRLQRLVRLAQWLRLPSTITTTHSKYDAV